MSYDRSFATGRTVMLKVTGQITLHFCGGKSVANPPVITGFPMAGDGWEGSNYFYATTGFLNQQSSIEANLGLGATVRIQTGIVTGPNPAHPGDPSNSFFGTTIDLFGFDLTSGFLTDYPVATWYNDADPDWDAANPTLTPPSEDITVSFLSTLDCDEWAQEVFAPIDTGGGPFVPLRPGWAGGVHRILRLKPNGNVHTTLTFPGGVGTFSKDTKPLISALVDRAGFLQEDRATFDPDLTPDPSSAYILVVAHSTLGLDAPFFFSTSPLTAEAAHIGFNGSPRWYGNTNAGFNQPINDPQPGTIFPFDGRKKDLLRILTWPDYSVQAIGTARDWNGNLSSVPVNTDLTFGTVELLLSRASPVGITGNRGVIQPVIVVGYLLDHNYNPDDSDSLVMKQGSTWPALKLDRDPTAVALQFGVTPSGHSWTPTHCTATPSGTQLVCAATGGAPSLTRTLKNDLIDIDNDTPAVWFAANGASIDPRFLAWYQGEAGGPTQTKAGPGDWRRIGRRLLSTSDLFNWHPWRYADLTAKADTACTVTLRVDYDNVALDGADLLRTPRYALYTVDLTTTMEAHEIDLPSALNHFGNLLVGHDGLRCVTGVTVTFPAGRTVTLDTLRLKEKARPVVDCHLVGHGTGDDPALVSALGDGKAILWFPAVSVWGVSAKETADGSSLLMSTYATEIALQEGWSATVAGRPDDGSPDYAINLEETFESVLPFTLKARRGYGALAVYPQSGQSADFLANLGNAIHGLLFDPDTHKPAMTLVGVFQLDFFSQPGSVYHAELEQDASTSDATGIFRLELQSGGAFELRSSPGTANEIIFPAHIGASNTPQPFATASRTWYLAAFGGKGSPHAGGGPVVLDIDRLGNAWVSFSDGNAIKLGRRLGAAPTFDILDVGVIGADSWIQADETNPDLPINIVFTWGADTIYLATSRANGTGGWRLRQIATGTHGFLRKDKASGLTFYTYWTPDAGGTINLLRSQNDGVTFLEAAIAVKTGAPEATAVLDWRLDDLHTCELVLFDGTNLQSLTSTDNGRTWA